MTGWLLLAGTLALAAVIAWVGVSRLTAAILPALWSLPLAITLHAVQLWLSAIAWRLTAGGAGPGLITWSVIRWVREAVNSTLPVAQLGGNVAGVRLLSQRGLPVATGTAATALDLAIEAGTQAGFTLLGIGVLAALTETLPAWAWAALLALTGIALGFAALLRPAGLRWMERLLTRRLPRAAAALAGFRAEVVRLGLARAALLRAGFLHSVAYGIGVIETALFLLALAHPLPWAAAIVIEALALAARSAAFAVPGALGVQEGGFLLSAGLFGVPPETAIALSMLKRARELGVGVTGLLAWRAAERTTKA